MCQGKKEKPQTFWHEKHQKTFTTFTLNSDTDRQSQLVLRGVHSVSLR